MTHGRILAALPQRSLAITQHCLSDVLQTETRSEPGTECLGAGRLPEGTPGLFVCGCALMQSSKLDFG